MISLRELKSRKPSRMSRVASAMLVASLCVIVGIMSAGATFFVWAMFQIH